MVFLELPVGTLQLTDSLRTTLSFQRLNGRKATIAAHLNADGLVTLPP